MVDTTAVDSYISWGTPTGYAPDRRTLLPTLRAADIAVEDFNQDANLDLAASAALMRNIQALLRLYTAGSFAEESASEDLRAALAAAVGAPDFASAKDILVQAQRTASAHCSALLGTVDPKV